MSTYSPSLETLIVNADELYALAEILECKVDVPVTKLKKSLVRTLILSSAGPTGELPTGLFPTPIETNPILCLTLVATYYVGKKTFDVGKHVALIIKNTYARKKAEEALLPLHQEIAVKIQETVCQNMKDKQELEKRLGELQQKNAENEKCIQELKARIHMQDKIIAGYDAVFAAG